jgi:hypothetical protein
LILLLKGVKDCTGYIITRGLVRQAGRAMLMVWKIPPCSWKTPGKTGCCSDAMPKVSLVLLGLGMALLALGDGYMTLDPTELPNPLRVLPVLPKEKDLAFMLP